MSTTVNQNVDEAVKQLREATAAKKCWQCGCLHSSLRAIEEAFEQEFASDVLPKDVLAILPPDLLVRQVPAEIDEELRRIGRKKGLKSEALDRFVLKEFAKRR